MEAREQIRTIQLKNVLEKSYNKHIFSNNEKSISLYKKSMKKAIKLIAKHLESRDTPFTGTSIATIKEKIDAIALEDNY